MKCDRPMTERKRENRDRNRTLSLLRCGRCGVAWLSRAGLLLMKKEGPCLRCGGPLGAAD
jgi:hypothetical protein